MSPQPQAAVGAPLSRVDGRLKVTGQAKYAADFPHAGTTSRGGTPIPVEVVHAVIVSSTVARGRITGIDTRAAEAQHGVLKVITHLNAPRLAYRDNPVSFPFPGRRLRALQDDAVQFFGQPVAVVVATTLEAAQHAGDLVEVSYDAEEPATDLTRSPGVDGPRPFAQPYARGDAQEALGSADVRMDLAFRLSRNHHNPMETHATVARWDGDKLTLWDKTQWVIGAQNEAASVFGIPPENVRVLSPFVGGAFGNALRTGPHVAIAALAAREVGRPVKLALTRRQMYFTVGYRPAYEYKLSLGSTRRGRLTAMVHEMKYETSRYEQFWEANQALGQMLYAVPNVSQSVRTVPLDVSTPMWMRGPGYGSAAFAIETAMDELAHKLGIDPIELRLRNEPAEDPSTQQPFSTRRLAECFRVGARTFGWHRRDPKPRSTRDGDWLIGTGVATGCYDVFLGQAQAHARLDADGTAVVQSATHDTGTGTYTSMTQVAADALGLAVRNVTFRLGDSAMPPAPPQGASQTMATVGSAVQDTCDKLRQQAITLAVEDERSPLHGVAAADVVVRGGRLHVEGDPTRGETYRQLLARNNRTHLEARGSWAAAENNRFSMYGYAAMFAEVAVDARLGLVRVRRMLGVYDAGRIISPKLADSQAIGGMVGGIGAALLEHTVTDHRDGRIVNANLADYLVPVNADVPDLKAVYLDGEDNRADPIGVKSLGELVQIGVAPAIANAVFHATGRRVRELPITAEALL
ncbi:xanthine dehydrogenase family protein molybdopterin-binding subunit [Streptomyces europaeiscabiei]|uniref:xanthine dehydrogenase family protein molybdopterin-binding subunit n=1 Tax=Streptomyces europaeiscabiei TaxID=146819 RepID=UPI0029BF34DC|nr:xanthine dehydrogenase family protein molybdopterin-binding subunit [Streptomyces europaeiscabiei]MDX3613196.1 xanthine dehydrogenase family protein molybdopterin-binding subunit [Streptomyces europaeiscabiei]MDX3636366.1 xanthine dehydrogenase family protein molybdopterin-binding subunit [Streptomyces europaeiscabiei]MDX3654539.1 xanthine dehydrogenase family protein molybdopterin-binding subunit [Streptomyces europaeiscabiei]WUD34271.1 xanthine dehydrogenase family protein molybdopterin-bi